MVVDFAAGGSELVVDFAAGGSELVVDFAAGGSEQGVDFAAEGSELVVDPAEEGGELGVHVFADTARIALNQREAAVDLRQDVTRRELGCRRTGRHGVLLVRNECLQDGASIGPARPRRERRGFG